MQHNYFVTQMNTSQSQQAAALIQPTAASRFPAFSGMREGIRMHRASSRVQALLSGAIARAEPECLDAVKEAAETFATLDQKRQAKVISFVEKKMVSTKKL